VYVKGAKPGDLLEIEYLDIRPERYGWTRFAPGGGFLPDLFDYHFVAHWDITPEYATSPQLPGVRIPNGAFMGTAGVAPSHEQLRRWSVRHARGLNAFYHGFESLLVSCNPLWRLGRLQEARELLLRCQTVFEQQNAIHELAGVFIERASLEFKLDCLKEARRFVKTGLRYAYAAAEPEIIAISHFNFATYLCVAGGDWRAGLAAAEHAKWVAFASLDTAQIEQAEKDLLAPFSNTGGESPYAVHRDLQETMQNLVGIFRVEEDLKKALVALEALSARAARASVEGSRLFNPGWHLARDLQSMLVISEAVGRSALARLESRGAHSRIDYPKLDEAWGKKNNIIVREGEAMKLLQSAVAEMPADLRQLLVEK
jgi:hypothetical protein